MGDFACAGKPTTVAGPGLHLGFVSGDRDRQAGGARAAGSRGEVTLYEASGTPSNPKLGAYVGTWTYTAHQFEQWTPGGTAVFGAVAHGQIVFADGSTAMLKVSFTLLEGSEARRCSFPKQPAAESDEAAPLKLRRPGHDPGLRFRHRTKRLPRGRTLGSVAAADW